ncbi:putative repeat protein (TIGR02059 family) [Fontibacillus phaseoli]|uniref:Putative repeat protein (TIGR02059 family) n=1 Tax=Fontibacillus phaseoli TaxID=1416533 RepID=A0A369BHD5_9BACL|nr:SwmB domain-containing protein [Fontibacillus phaseoli]RCX19094.1 putative repeat protein (TIGR02059 family) [Fontibacillus phaseoli]
MKRKVSALLAIFMVINLLSAWGSLSVSAAIPPTDLDSSSPANGENNVPINTKIKMKFNQKVTSKGSIWLTKSGTGGSQSINATVTTATYDVELSPFGQLEYNTLYTVQVPEGTFVGEDGTTNDAEYWSFRTVAGSTGSITVSSFNPSAGSTNVSVNVQPSIQFNKNVKLNTSQGGLTLRRSSSSTSVPINVTTSGYSTVTISPQSVLEPGTTYYVEADRYGIVDAGNSSNYFEGFSGSSRWWFTTASANDKTAPVLQNATMNSNTSIRLQYNEDLNSSAYVSSSNFSVTVNGETRRISYVSVSGQYVYVYLETGVAVGQDVKISYTGQTVRDEYGNLAATFSGKQVTNGIDTVSPKPRDGYVSGDKVVLYFSESLKSPSSYAYQQFTVTANDSIKSISSMTHSGSTITLNLSSSVANGEVVKVSYSPGSYRLQDYRGMEIAGFSDYFVRNYNDNVAPVFKSAEGSGKTIILNYNEPLRTTRLPLKSQFSVLVNNAPVYVNAVEVVNNQVKLTLATSFTQNQAVTISYVAGGSDGIADLAGNLAGYINLQQVTYASVAEGVRSATVTGDTLTITYNNTLRSMSYLPVNQFNVFVDKISMGITSATISGNTVILKLATPVTAGQVVTLSYLTGASSLYDTLGNQLKSFNNMSVQNTAGGQTNQTGQTPTTPTTQPDYLTTMSNVDFGVGGYLLNISAAQATDSRSKFGQGIKKYTIDTVKLQNAYKYLTGSNAATKRIVFEVPSTEKAAEVVIPVTPLMEMYSSGKTGTFAVKYNSVMYELPIEKIPFMEISRSLNVSALTSAFITIQLEPVTKVQMPTLNYNNGVTTTPLVDPIQVSVTVFSGTASQNAVELNATGNIYMKAANTLASDQTFLAQYELLTRTASFVPSSVKGAGSAFVFSGKINGSKAVGPAAGYSYFTDTLKHWASKDITELASKLVVDSRSGAKFEPDKNITRVEFAIFIAKGLGLTADAANARRFSDVAPGSTVAGYIGAAAKAGIINGNTDGTFKPGSFITREQMALMMVRAMEYAGHDTNLGSSSGQVLGRFKDGAKIQSKETVAKAVKEGIIQGVSANRFQPAGNATRAQAAVMLKRVLDKINNS